MDTLSFILGIASVVVIATAIVAVYAFVKVNKLEEQLEQSERNFSQELERVYRNMHDEIKAVYDHISSRVREIDSTMDSQIGRAHV